MGYILGMNINEYLQILTSIRSKLEVSKKKNWISSTKWLWIYSLAVVCTGEMLNTVCTDGMLNFVCTGGMESKILWIDEK